jgi:DNA-binding beta-propeller fold protein YncE
VPDSIIVEDSAPDRGREGGFVVGEAIQTIMPQGDVSRYEGITFSPAGDRIAVATSEGNTILIYRRHADGLFEDAPAVRLNGPGARLDYPHDAAFAQVGDRELLAVANRGGTIGIWEKHRDDAAYPPDPAFEIGGPEAELNYSDGVAFVPPHNDHLAVCNLLEGTVTFYRMTATAPVAFRKKPVFMLRHPCIKEPDGIALSPCGRWLASANHGNNSISVFRRRSRWLTGTRLRFHADPVSVIRDDSLRYPHSVAFSPRSNALVATNAGANYFNVYARLTEGSRHGWAQEPTAQHIVGDETTFRAVNAGNKMEGGPKGIAIHGNRLAICNPEYGLKIYPFIDRPT